MLVYILRLCRMKLNHRFLRLKKQIFHRAHFFPCRTSFLILRRHAYVLPFEAIQNSARPFTKILKAPFLSSPLLPQYLRTSRRHLSNACRSLIRLSSSMACCLLLLTASPFALAFVTHCFHARDPAAPTATRDYVFFSSDTLLGLHRENQRAVSVFFHLRRTETPRKVDRQIV